MHIDRTNQVPVPGEPAFAAFPISAFGLVFVPTCRTPARCASFRAGKAHDVSGFGFVGEIIDIFSIFPAGHTLVVMPALIVVTHTMRVADEERPDLVLHTEVDHLPARFMVQIADTPFSTVALFVPGSLQLLPVARILLAPSLFLGDFAKLLIALPFERTDATPGDNHSLASIGGDGCQVDLAQVDCGLDRARGIFCLGSFHAHMQLKATIPDQATGAAVFRQGNVQDQGRTPFAHRQHHTPTLIRDGLSRPLDRIKAFGPPGVLHLHLGMSLAELACGFDVSEEGGHDHLYRLAVQRETPFGSFLQGISTRPLRMVDPCCFVRFHTSVPHLRCFHLSSFAVLELLGRQMIQSEDFDRLHGYNGTTYEDSLQVGKTRYTDYSIAYHLVWIPKYRRRILTGGGTKRDETFDRGVLSTARNDTLSAGDGRRSYPRGCECSAPF